jgi:iron uptake system EfeUOB component EfeO/EfeM
VDPVAEKFKELEARIDAWQNKFEFVDVGKK